MKSPCRHKTGKNRSSNPPRALIWQATAAINPPGTAKITPLSHLHHPMSATQPRKLFVTTALPYANGAFHIGHIMEYIQADIWVRFQRMCGNEVHFVGADDAHGTPIMIAAEKEGITPQAF